MYILGLMGLTGQGGTGCHDASAALFKDGRIIVAAEQERFSRKKHAPNQGPDDAPPFCLNFAHISISDVDYVTYGWMGQEEEHPETVSQWIVKSFDHSDELLSFAKVSPYRIPIYYVKQHVAHIQAAYNASGFRDAACLIIDGRGESESITLAEIFNGEIEVIKQYPVAYSLGFLYEAASRYCGLGYDVPGKFMGLSSYGKPHSLDSISFDSETGKFTWPVIQRGESISSLVDAKLGNRWLDYFQRHCYPYKVGTKATIMHYLDFVATIQRL
jgi:predicted NodU family carbamoyl transferase